MFGSSLLHSSGIAQPLAGVAKNTSGVLDGQHGH